MTETRAENPELGSSTLTRRERLERMAAAERDRRADRIEMAVAAIGEAIEWPARMVLALARLPRSEGVETRRLLEERLDVWAREIGLGSLDTAGGEDPVMASELAATDLALGFEPNSLADQLDRPLDSFELDRAFEQAKTEVEEMHDVNRIAESVLLEEPKSFVEFAGDDLAPIDAASMADAVAARDEVGVDAAYVEPVAAAQSTASQETLMIGPSNYVTLATLDRWLQNLGRRIAGTAQ